MRGLASTRSLDRRLPPEPPFYSGRWTRLYTARPDGSDVRLINDSGMVSHFDWRDDRTILAWARTKNGDAHFHLIDALTGQHHAIAEKELTQDGHCSYSPDRRWFLTDTYPDPQDHKQTLMLVRVSDTRIIEIGRFYEPPAIQYKPYRCDLHPRWNRDGTRVCIDSTHEGSRQMYVIDVSRYTKA